MDLKKKQAPRNRLAFSGPLTVQNAAKYRSELIAKFEQCDQDGFELELVADSAADLSGVQLILAARRFASEHRKQFGLAKPAGGTLREVLEQGGFLRNDTADARSFWLHEKAE